MVSFSENAFKEALQYVNALLGTKIAFQSDGGWAYESNRYLVSPKYYTNFGFLEDEMRVMLLLDSWVIVYAPEIFLRRQSTRASVLFKDERLLPILQMSDRLEAISDISLAFVGFRGSLKTSFAKFTGRDIRKMPPETQFLTFVMACFLGTNKQLRVNTAVADLFPDQDEFAATLRTVLKKDPQAAEDLRFKRLVALMRDPYVSLLEEEADQEHGLTGFGAGEDVTDAVEQDLDFGSNVADADSFDDREATQSEEESNERLSQQSDMSEGADLFEASGAAPIESFISSPLEAASRRASELQLEQEAKKTEGVSNVLPRETAGQAGGGVDEYLTLTDSLHTEIAHMFEVWMHHHEEKSAIVRAYSRSAQSSGDRLDVSRLASTFVQARAGVPEPEAFNSRTREFRPRENLKDSDFVLILDRSASMGVAKQVALNSAIVLIESLTLVIEELEDAARSLDLAHEEVLPVDVRTAVIVFDSDAHTVKPLTSKVNDGVRRDLLKSIKDVGGATNDALALHTAGQVFKKAVSNKSVRRDRKKIIIMVGDGESTDMAAALKQLQKLQGEGVEVWGVGVKAELFEGRLQNFGKSIETEQELMDAVLEIVQHSLRQ